MCLQYKRRKALGMTCYTKHYYFLEKQILFLHLFHIHSNDKYDKSIENIHKKFICVNTESPNQTNLTRQLIAKFG